MRRLTDWSDSIQRHSLQAGPIGREVLLDSGMQLRLGIRDQWRGVRMQDPIHAARGPYLG